MTRKQRATLTNTHHRTEFADQVFKAIRNIPSIDRVAAGPIGRCSPSQRRVRVDDLPSAISLLVRGVADVQTLYVYGKSLSAARLAIVQSLHDKDIQVVFRKH